jgi:hypothetical protein
MELLVNFEERGGFEKISGKNRGVWERNNFEGLFFFI